jgi:hypothetical protein
MSNNFLVVLFKNRKRKKIIKRFSTEKRAYKYFDSLIGNNQVEFEKKVENATEVDYELGLLTSTTNVQKSLFTTDEMGRNNPVNLDNSEYVFLEIKKYKIEETIFDWQTSNKITLNEIIETYCKTKELKNIFTLNNKICIQINEDVFAFSLKDKEESYRLLESFQNYFIQKSRTDAMFVRDISIAQRKWIYNLLEEKGFDKKRLYRLKTTFSKR